MRPKFKISGIYFDLCGLPFCPLLERPTTFQAQRHQGGLQPVKTESQSVRKPPVWHKVMMNTEQSTLTVKMFVAVLWIRIRIRIRKDPKLFAGSGSVT
jgi:hypothetical protein